MTDAMTSKLIAQVSHNSGKVVDSPMITVYLLSMIAQLSRYFVWASEYFIYGQGDLTRNEY